MKKQAVGKARSAQAGKRAAAGHLFDWRFPALVAVVAFACYAQTAGYGFVYDDEVQVVQNTRIRSFANLGRAFDEHFWAFGSLQSYSNYYRPLQTVTYMAAYGLGALAPPAYHWINILLHVFAGLAAFWFAWELFGQSHAALWGGLMFAAHPMHTESVAWVGGLTDLGCGVFYFVALAAFLRSRNAGGRRLAWMTLSAVSFFAALLYKEMAVSLPVLALLLGYARDSRENTKRRPRELAVWCAPYAAALGFY
ncbi:MAG: hypothetical protein FJW35_13960, partial [Acidobacteria bacterium]|nr:hypothetical protein [Acidobacteriota bacterium]